MTQHELKDQIVSLLENIVKRSQLIEKQSGTRNLLEIDLAMEDVRLLYRHFEQLRHECQPENSSAVIRENTHASIPTASSTYKPAAQPERDIAEVQPPIQEVPLPIAETRVNPEPEKPQMEVPEKKEEALENKEKSPTATPVEETAKAPDPKVIESAESKDTPNQVPPPSSVATSELSPRDKKILGERYPQANARSIHERLAQMKEDTSIGARMQLKPITSLREAIGVNEKFLFINELFQGDLKAYNESIERLNTTPSVHEAFELLNVFTNQYAWDGNRSAETIEKLANLVQRRHMG